VGWTDVPDHQRGQGAQLARLGGTVRAVETLYECPGVALPPRQAAIISERLAKARAVWNALGVTAVGEDSGLEVD
jgi:hypothetical protein